MFKNRRKRKKSAKEAGHFWKMDILKMSKSEKPRPTLAEKDDFSF
jgi:hypothetical protein